MFVQCSAMESPGVETGIAIVTKECLYTLGHAEPFERVSDATTDDTNKSRYF